MLMSIVRWYDYHVIQATTESCLVAGISLYSSITRLCLTSIYNPPFKNNIVMFRMSIVKHQASVMDAHHVIEWYDWLLFCSGGKLYADSEVIFYANWSLKILNAVAYLFMIFADSLVPSAFNFSEASVVQWLADKVNALLALAFSATLTYYGGRVTQLLEECLTLVDDVGRKKIRDAATCLSIVCFSVAIVMAVTGIALDAHSIANNTHGKTTGLIIGAALAGFISLNSWFNNAMILYVIFVYTLTKREVNQLIKMATTLTAPKLEPGVIQQIVSQRKHLHFLILEVNRLVGFCPLFMFGFMFILTPAIITDIRENVDIVAIVMLTIFLVLSFAAIVVLLLFVHQFMTECRILSHEVIERAYSLKEYDIRCQDLVREVDASNNRLTAWNLFDVNSNFFLSFTSAVFTFTVLFIQLNINSLKQAELRTAMSNATGK